MQRKRKPRHAHKPTAKSGKRKRSQDADYGSWREEARSRVAEMSRSGRDIGEIPAVVNPKRRAKCEASLLAFLEEYFAEAFYLEWSSDHLRVIQQIENICRNGGLKALAMPRGFGKTAIIERAAIWVLLCGLHQYVAVIGPDEPHALDRIASIRMVFETNDKLLEDFPEVCYPFRKLEGITQRRLLYRGRPVRMKLSADRIVLPDIPGSKSAMSIVGACGITGQIRGLATTLPDGRVIRPSYMMCDDPQTRESAHSDTQCQSRESTISQDILGLVAPGKSKSVLVPCTVIRKGDMADRLLDRKLHPQWRGERTKLVRSWPKNKALWDKYAELWRKGEDAEVGPGEATEFYRQNRAAMDDGADVSWPARVDPGELSAIQNAMNLRLSLGDTAFACEYQNDPPDAADVGADELKPEDIAKKLNGIEFGIVPSGTSHLTMFIDVQDRALFYVVTAWGSDFTGNIIAYGTEPDQGVPYFAYRNVRKTLKDPNPKASREAQIYAGLQRLTESALGCEWKGDDGTAWKVERCLIDANWGESTDVVYQFCRQSTFAGVVMPSHGKYIGAASNPMREWARRPGDRVGLNWRVPALVQGRRVVRHVIFDTNFWKSFLASRLAVPMGDPGCLALFGHSNERHRMISEHITAEYRVRTEGRGRKVDEWKPRPNRDNHLLDCAVGCCVAASMVGASLPTVHADGIRSKPKISYAERYAAWKKKR